MTTTTTIATKMKDNSKPRVLMYEARIMLKGGSHTVDRSRRLNPFKYSAFLQNYTQWSVFINPIQKKLYIYIKRSSTFKYSTFCKITHSGPYLSIPCKMTSLLFAFFYFLFGFHIRNFTLLNRTRPRGRERERLCTL